MSSWTVVIVSSLLCLVLKLIGHFVPPTWLEDERMSRTSDLITVALLGALVAVQTLADGQGLVLDARIIALAVAAVLYARRVPFVVVVIVGAAVAAGLRAAFPGL